MCITQAAPAWVARARCVPAVVTTLSSVRLPNSVRRAVNPGPGAVIVLLEAPAPKIRSVGWVVVAVPLVTELSEPIAALWTSRGSSVTTPEYSCT